MTTITLRHPSFLTESMTFDSERELLERYYSLIKDVDFQQEQDLSEEVIADILKNYDNDVLYTNI